MSFEMFYNYVLMTVLNLPITHVLLSVANKILGVAININGVKCLILSVVSAIILPILMEVFENRFSVKIETEKEDN